MKESKSKAKTGHPMLEIPRTLPWIVRSVAESLALRDIDTARRYLQTYQQK